MTREGFSPELAELARQLASRLGGNGRAALDAIGERAPEERSALAFMLELVERTPEAIARVAADPARLSDLVFCLGSSEMIGAALCANTRWEQAFDSARASRPDSFTAASGCELSPEWDKAAAGRALAEFKQARFLRISIADLLGRLEVAATMQAMSDLADECIAAALGFAMASSLARGGPPLRFCVIAMGKLGARELNLSSDIDLVYLFDADDPVAETVHATRIAELVSELLAGNCFRVDLRLRPGGANSPLVASFDGALNFYQSYGQTWERAALLRARPAAGDLGLGRRLIRELGGFVYRRYLDFETLRQLRAMKHRIERELRSPDLVERNIKLGYGGIRELEFVVQALTLIYGGRDPRLRVAQTLDALERLRTHGYLDAARARELKDAYLFFRDVEHKLQVVNGLQTHTLPAGDSGMRALAARMRMGKSAAAARRLEALLLDHRRFVATQFRETLASGELWVDRPSAEPAAQAWRAAAEPEVSAPILRAYGFNRAEESASHLLTLARGSAAAPASPRRRELLERLGPRLLEEIAALADPDLALKNLASFIAAVGARTSFLALLEEHPATRRILLRLFASSEYLSAVFIRHPEMLDTLVRSDLARLTRSPAELKAELDGLLSAAADFEERLDALRSLRHQEFLRIAIADLADELRLPAVQAELTVLAEECLRKALILARSEISTRRPIPPTLELCVIAMGRLGAGEMTYNSDLDLIFIYRDRLEFAARSHELAARIAQKLIAVLETRTREGYVYKLDTRLRPSGNAGALVTSIEGWRAYHERSSAVWERQALVRARAIAGEPELAGEFEATRRHLVFDRSLSADEVREIGAMRGRMEREIGAETPRRLNLKQGRGGLVDIEFLVQLMAMRYGGRHPELRRRDTFGLIRALGETRLLPRVDAENLEADYVYLVRLENRLRIASDQAAWAVPTDPALLGPLARRMGYEGREAAVKMLNELAERRSRVRTAWERCLRDELERGEV